MTCRLVIDGNPRLRRGLSAKMLKVLGAISEIFQADEMDRDRMIQELGVSQDFLNLSYLEFARRGITKLIHEDSAAELSLREEAEVVSALDQGRAKICGG